MPFDIQIYSKFNNPALEFTVKFIFERVLGLSYCIVHDTSRLRTDQRIINYSDEALEGFQIGPADYISNQEFEFVPGAVNGYWQDIPIVFSSSGSIPFDIFSAVFFCLSRAEELNINERDDHGRPLARNSWLFRNGLLRRPIVDEWIVKLGAELHSNYPDLEISKREFNWINTFDIDVAFAHRHRPIQRIVGGMLKRLKERDVRSVSDRFKVLLGLSKDKYDTYDIQEEVSRKIADKTYYFFLAGGKSEFDNALDIDSKGMKELIERVSKYAEIGIHPSYESSGNPLMIISEKEILENSAKLKIGASRQHFLRLNIESGLNNLLESGIRKDFSLGYAEEVGFRSGTATPHFYFDLHNNIETKLELYPLHMMDGTFKDYMKCSTSDALSILEALIFEIKKVGGTFISLWHNDTLRSDDDWVKVYIQMSKLANK